MRLIVAVYDALRSFDRPCTRFELEMEAGLSKHEVRNGLDGLRRRGLILVNGNPRERATYRLRPGARRPDDLRGRGERTPETRQRIAASVARCRSGGPTIMLLDSPSTPLLHRASMPASHHAAPSVIRTKAAAGPFSTGDAGLLLQQLWRKR